jgi:predicted RNA methylase
MTKYKKLLKKFLPEYIILLRRKCLHGIWKQKRDKQIADIVSYMESIVKDLNKEQVEILNNLKSGLNLPYPYIFSTKYKPNDITVYQDKRKKLFYVLYNDKRMFFPKNWGTIDIKSYCTSIFQEQDIDSPHKYETSKFYVSEGDVVVDAGAAEGSFALSVVDKAKELYLFEPDKDWIEPLKATFAPWKNKVSIINNYVSNTYKNGRGGVILDDFFGGNEINFIKVDIEGAEAQLLKGAEVILSRKTSMKIVLCTYHKHNDADVLNQMLVEKGFHTEFSKGYCFLHLDQFAPPYLRKCLVRGEK